MRKKRTEGRRRWTEDRRQLTEVRIEFGRRKEEKGMAVIRLLMSVF
jgi:hypothetical protein